MGKMRWTTGFGLAGLGLSAFAVAGAQNVPATVKTELPSLIAIYRDFHASPELSHAEIKSSAVLAGELRKAGFTVSERVGKYPDGTQAYGVVGVLKNGPGRTLLVRTDMDALPLEEKTNLPYASKVRTENSAGQQVGVMHACGHDIHMTTMVGLARVMSREKAKWHGTLLVIGQPSEEVVDGARAMLSDRLYERFGRPDMSIALHDSADLAAGKVGITSGPAMAGSRTISVTMRGMGGHGAAPNLTKDPVVLAAEFVLAAQTIVSRQQLPTDPAVVTIGIIQGGTKANIIPDEVKMGLSVRFFDDGTRDAITAAVRRIADGISYVGGMPEDRRPLVEIDPAGASPTYNDPALTTKVRSALVEAVGAGNVVDQPPVMVSEDFGQFGLEGHQIPTVLFRLGAIAPERVAESARTGVPLPSLHSSLFEPLPEPTLRTGVTAMSDVALALLQ